MKKKNRIKRSDYNRVIITETLPFETPIIFSNDGLYGQVASLEAMSGVRKSINDALVLGKGIPNKIGCTSPYLYKIRKNSKEFRRLALLHPLSQWRIKCFYQKYEQLMLHYCANSPVSIRFPKKIAGSFYRKSAWENIHQYKRDVVALAGSDDYVKHAPSFFSYSGYDRLYKFFNSKDYYSLEKKFLVLATLDVSKCFDSIYTHSLSWAIKDKDFTKENVSVWSTFSQEFDQVIRHGNHNETNGIPIGPEVSRVFAEMIFQEIDRQAVVKIGDHKFGVDYEFRRYVDDVFIFAVNEEIAMKVYDTYADVLISFNLHVNRAKSSISQRPFLTSKSRLIFEAGVRTNEFLSKFLEGHEAGTLKPKRIFSKWKLAKSYIDSIKALCSSDSVGYDEVTPFLISVLTERVKKLVREDVERDNEELHGYYLAAIEVLLDILFFFYSVAPSVGSSYKVSTSLILLFRFSEKNLPLYVSTVSHQIYSLAKKLLLEQCGKPHVEGIDGFINLEYLNIALAVRELGGNYLLPAWVLDDLFVKNRRLSYFTIISCIFYMKDDMQYQAIRRKIFRIVLSRLKNMSDIFVNSEKAYLFLDLLSCPYIPNENKSQWLVSFYHALEKAVPKKKDINEFLAVVCHGYWHIDWKDVDLLNSLEKRELKRAY